MTIHALTPAALLRLAREAIPPTAVERAARPVQWADVPHITAAEAAERCGIRAPTWRNTESAGRSARTVGRLLTSLHGRPWVVVEGPDWAVGGPADDVRALLDAGRGES